jgi:hypothetical protein
VCTSAPLVPVTVSVRVVRESGDDVFAVIVEVVAPDAENAGRRPKLDTSGPGGPVVGRPLR